MLINDVVRFEQRGPENMYSSKSPLICSSVFAFQNNLERNEFETKQRFGKQIEALERDKTSLQKRLEAAEKQHNAANQQWEVQFTCL